MSKEHRHPFTMRPEPLETDHSPVQVDIDEVALQFGKSRDQLLTMVSSMLEGPLGAMSDVERQLLDEFNCAEGQAKRPSIFSIG